MVSVVKMAATLWLLAAVFMLGAAVGLAQNSKHKHNYYDFFVKETTYDRLCVKRSLLTVNDMLPGPTITARRGDIVIVNVHNQSPKDITIHWHGVDQPRNPWYDGPEFITQCPIKPGNNFTYEILLSDEEGTIWWHAHSGLDRAGVYGAFIVHPKKGTDYPFIKYSNLHKEIPILLGDWWNSTLDDSLQAYLVNGTGIPEADAHTINGQPGDLIPCGRGHAFTERVHKSKTYLLRIINAGLDQDMWFGVADHNLTVVGTDGRYLKNFTVEAIMVSPGQTMDVLLHTKSSPSNSRYYMGSKVSVSLGNLSIPDTSTGPVATAILEYEDTSINGTRLIPNLPSSRNITAQREFTAKLRSLNSVDHPVNVPTVVTDRLIITLAINRIECSECTNSTRIGASLNNASFADPHHANVLDAYVDKITGVYDPTFPDEPPFKFNYFDSTAVGRYTNRSTKVKVVPYGAVVELVFQGTFMGAENHPMHLHGFAFYTVGRGLGIFNESTDPFNKTLYNTEDPPYQNTVTAPRDGWTAIRFHATNPGVWFMHCHFDRHTVYGMSTAFIVTEGPAADEKMRPRPSSMPKC